MLLLITKEISAQKHYTEKSQFLCWLLIFLYWNFKVLEIRIFPIMSNFNVELQNKQHFVLLKNTRPDLIKSELYIFNWKCSTLIQQFNFEIKELIIHQNQIRIRYYKCWISNRSETFFSIFTQKWLCSLLQFRLNIDQIPDLKTRYYFVENT